MKSYVFSLFFILVVWACANDKKENVREQSVQSVSEDAKRPVQTIPNQPPVQGDNRTKPLTTPEEVKEAVQNLKPGGNVPTEPILLRGVNLTDPVHRTMALSGKGVYERKGCNNCHSLGTSVVKAAGFGGITKRRKPEWIMNMTTGVKMTLDNDPAVNSRLQACPSRHPDTRLSIIESRDILEFYRMNDGEKTD
jgi:hypothetical protein